MPTIAEAVAGMRIEQGALRRYKWVRRQTGERCWSCNKETENCYPKVHSTEFRCDNCDVTWESRVVLK